MDKMRLMGSLGSVRMVVALVMVLLNIQLWSAYAKFDGFDGRPRPDGMLDAPTKTYGEKLVATYVGQPASCTWYGWESFNYDRKDTKDCSKELWASLKKLPPENLQAFGYFTLETFPQNMYCTIGCFDLSATAPPPIAVTPPPQNAATPPPPVNAQPDPPPPVNAQPDRPPPPVNAQPDPPPPPSPPPPPIASPARAPSSPPPPIASPAPAPSPPPPPIAIPAPAPSPPPPPIASPGASAPSSPPPPSIASPGPSSSSSPDPAVASAPAPSSRPQSQIGLIAGICSAGVGAILLVGLLWLCCFKHRKKQAKTHQSTSGLCTDMQLSRPYTFKELSAITNNFGDSELLASGAFGDVFKGKLLSPGGRTQLVAVKRIRRHKEHGQASFVAEANSLRQIRHRNLLQLRGWCDAKEGMFLVYDFMSNGSLDTWLHTNPGCQGPTLPWHVRQSVLAGVAEGLEYLHEGWVQCVLHRDIKSSNVLLDERFNPHLGDFGLARLVDHQKMEKTTVVAGTLGYMAPEMFHTGRATKETDVYAFGILVLEVVCGRSPLDVEPILGSVDHHQGSENIVHHVLVDRVWRAHEAGNMSKMLDPRLMASTDHSIVSLYDTGDESSDLTVMITNVLQLGLLCCHPNPSERPSIRLVSHWFQSLEVGRAVDIQFPLLPAIQPSFPGRYFAPPTLSSTEGSSSSHDYSLASSPSSVQTSSPAMGRQRWPVNQCR